MVRPSRSRLLGPSTGVTTADCPVNVDVEVPLWADAKLIASKPNRIIIRSGKKDVRRLRDIAYLAISKSALVAPFTSTFFCAAFNLGCQTFRV